MSKYGICKGSDIWVLSVHYMKKIRLNRDSNRTEFCQIESNSVKSKKINDLQWYCNFIDFKQNLFERE